MATISLLSYGNPSAMQTQLNNGGLKLSTINRNKCASVARNNNNNSDKTANLNGATMNTNIVITTPKPNNKRSYNVMSKKPKALPLTETNSNIVVTNIVTTMAPSNIVRPAKQSKVLKRQQNEIDPNILCRATGGKSKMFPLPVAVARRNARERNRVKQVNNGFAALRERIPEEVAEAYEAQGNGRGSVKKLSKVETLRMAVEYIRSLEQVLGMEQTLNDTSVQSISDCHLSNESYHLSDTSSIMSTLTPPPSDNISSGSFDDSDCALPDVTIIDGHQYIRIPGTNTYQLLESNINTNSSIILYENDENIEPQMLGHHQNILIQQTTSPTTHYANEIGIDATQCFTNAAIYNTPIHIMTPASISPDAYSGQSSAAGLSPAIHHDIISANASTIATSATVNTVKQSDQSFVAIIKNEISTALPSIDGGCENDSALYLNSFSTHQLNKQMDEEELLKTKIKDDIDLDEQEMSEENMIEAMHWWQSQQNSNNVRSS